MDIGEQTRIEMNKYDTLQKIVEQLEWCFNGADGGYKISMNVAFLKLKEMAIEQQRISNTPILSAVPSDTQRLDKLQALTQGYGKGWILRYSSTGRGMRLHETHEDGAEKDIRKAIDKFERGAAG